MIQTHSQIEVQSTIVGDKVAMTIDPNAMAHIMSILTDLYSDPEAAVIREYSVNARDSHVEAGQTRPIEVSTPTPLAPFLTITDYGVGLSVDDIHAIYSKYGASTKRETNEQTGMLGLGCKSALTYAQQFTLVGIKNGTRATVSISRDENGAGSMTIVDTQATDEHPGVQVVIPARRENDLAEKAAAFFAFWPEGSVLVDGRAPSSLDARHITDRLLITEAAESDLVVMGGVAYPTKLVEPGTLHYEHHLVAFVDIGAVDFAPSRELLMDTPHTKATLARIREEFEREAPAAVQREIDNAYTAHHAVDILSRWFNAMPDARKPPAPYTYGGFVVPSEIPQANKLVEGRRRHTLGAHSRYSTITTTQLSGSLWVHGFKSSKFNANHRKRLENWLGSTDRPTPRYYILTESTPVAGRWIDPANIIPWADVRAVPMPRSASAGSGRPAGSYNMIHRGRYQRGVVAADLPAKVYYHVGSRETTWWWADQFGELEPDAVVVILPSPRLAKFQRDFPNAKDVVPEFKARGQRWVRRLTDRQRLALSMEDADARDALRKLEPAGIFDPELRAAVEVAKIDLTKLIERRRLFRNAMRLDLDRYESPLRHYPLYDHNAPMDHNIHYLNSTYLAYENGALTR